MEGIAQYSHKYPKESDKPPNPAKKRRIIKSNASSSLGVEGVAPSPSALQSRHRSDQEQPRYISEIQGQSSPYVNYNPTTSEAPSSQKPTTSAVNEKHDSLERRKQMAQLPEGFNGTFHGPQASSGHETDYQGCLIEASSSQAQRQVVGQEHALSAETDISTGQNDDRSLDNSSRWVSDSSESIQVTHTSKKPLVTDRNGKSKDASHHHHLVDYGATNSAISDNSCRPACACDAKISHSQGRGGIGDSREAAMYSLNDQAAIMGRQDDSETSCRFQDAIAMLLHSNRNNQGQQLSHNHREETRSTTDSYYSRASSALPPVFPTGGDEASRLVSAAAALRTYPGLRSSSVASTPLYSNIASQQIRQPVSTSIVSSLREALQVNQHYQDIETEKARLLARISQSQPRNPKATPTIFREKAATEVTNLIPQYEASVIEFPNCQHLTTLPFLLIRKATIII
jgi:hypothetical protein